MNACCRERADGLFTPLCYLTARMIEELIIAFINAVAFSALAFYPVFLSGSFVPFFMAKFITTSIGISKPPLLSPLWAYPSSLLLQCLVDSPLML